VPTVAIMADSSGDMPFEKMQLQEEAADTAAEVTTSPIAIQAGGAPAGPSHLHIDNSKLAPRKEAQLRAWGLIK
jgi:hypothetical protein